MNTEQLGLVIDLSNPADPKVKAFNRSMQDMQDHLDKSKKKFTSLEDKLSQVEKVFHKVTSTIFSVKGALVGLASAAGIGLTARAFVEAASATEGYQTRLEVLLGSTSEAKRLFGEMTDYASRVPFTYDKIMESATALSGVLKGGVDQITEWMPMIGDLAAASGLTIEQTTQQVIRMYSAGAGAADLFRERGILAMMGFQAGVSYSAEETARKMMEAWEAPESKFRGTADRLGKTWAGLTSMLSDRWFQFRNMVMEAGVFDMMKNNLDDLIKKIDEFQKSGDLEKWAKSVGVAVIESFENMVKAAEFFLQMLLTIKTTYAGIKDVGSSIIVENLKAEKERIQEAISGGRDNWWRVLYPESVENQIDQANIDRLKQIDELIIKYERLGIESEKDALSAQKLADQMKEGFVELIQNIEDIKIGIQEAGETAKNSANEMEKFTRPTKTEGIIGYETYMDYYQAIQQGSLELKNQNMILGEMNPSIDRMVAGYDKFLTEIEDSQRQALELEKIFTSISAGISTSFRNAFRDILMEGELDFEKLGDSIRGVFADVIADIAKQKFITPFVNSAMTNIAGMPQGNVYPSNFVGSLPQGATYAGMGSTVMGGLGAGAMAYGMTGSPLAGLGSGAGYLIGGIPGAIAGAAVGMITDQITSSRDEVLPKIDVLWNVIDGQVQLVGKAWEDISNERAGEIISQIEDTLQSQVDFFAQIADISGQGLKDMSFNLQGQMGSYINQLTGGDFTTSQLIGGLLDLYPEMAATFGEQFIQDFGKAWEAMWAGNRAGSAASAFGFPLSTGNLEEYISGKSINALKYGEMQTFTSGSEKFGQYMTTGPYRNQLLTADTEGRFSDIFEKYGQKLVEMQASFSNMLGQSFLNALSTPGYSAFKNSFKRSLAKSIDSAFSQMIGARFTNILLGAGFAGNFNAVEKYITDLPYLSEGEKSSRMGQISSDFLNSVNNLTPVLEDMRPVFEALQASSEAIYNALGLNTEALTGNTDALIQNIDDFLSRLERSELNPEPSSIASLQYGYMAAQEAAIADPNKLANYLRYTESTYLPGIRGLSSSDIDYAGGYASVKQDILDLREAYKVRDELKEFDYDQLSEKNGQEIFKAFSAALYDIRELVANKEVTGTLTIDGSTVRVAAKSEV